MATHFFRTACGMPPEDAALYMTDNTGYKARALPGTNVPEEQRVHRLIHESDRRGLAGRGLAPTLQRYMDALDTRLSRYLSDDWVQLPDFWEFVQETVGGSMLEALFGKELQRLHPDFVHSFFEFDRQAPSLIKMTPFSGAEKIRNEVLAKYKTWFANARRNFTKEAIYPDGDGDPYWGCSWTRFRHDSFRPFFSEEALASSDLGVAWGALGNTTPCAMMAVAHAVRDKTLHARLRDEVDGLCDGRPLPAVNQKSFTNHTLLSAMYAETLRLYITVFIPVVPLHGELDLGKWRVPQSSMGMINAAIAHRNEDVWNTKGGLHPVDTFWAERFIIDPQNATSGPFRPECRDRCADSREQVNVKAPGGGEPYFSLRGLEGSWIPYGGGQNMCPGRFLAKGVITYMLAYMVRQFDLELPEEPIPLGTDRFGMGAELPTRPIPFRIRRRMAAGATTVT
ncbi:hypothetical protein N3K66_007253 [Trichothecium roseum]|uniref:Uncharacterized protein n=1 Tax=Trichothecium roseum TaxID=47278 RepID=A0ACC0UTY7_9HYPO|nr:hypothetical protein N3K66_007253 [Trichothecium roseum]